MRRVVGRVLLICAAVIAVAAVASWLTRSVGTGLGFTRHVSANGLELDIPYGWDVNTTGWPTSGFGSTFAIVGTQPWGPCLPGDLNCHYQQRLAPGQISVELSLVTRLGDFCETGATRSDLAGRGPDDPVATGRLMRVHGRPTIQTDYAVGRDDYYRSDEWRTWSIAAPDTTFYAYLIDARYRGPDIGRFRAQLDAMIAGLRLTGDPALGGEGPDDCGPPFPP